MSNLLAIAISGLKASQTALTVTGNNITNAGTEGYSRQVISQSATSSHHLGGNWIGTGVKVDSVTRVYDQFLTRQLWNDTASFNSDSVLALYAGNVDSLLADPGTGIQPGMENMFKALQTVVDDPASLPARSVLLSESQGLVDRFALINERLMATNETMNGQMNVLADQITSLSRSIANLNEQIQLATGVGQGKQPSDLMDKRDLMVKELASIVSVNVVEQDDLSWNISIGNGQPLVIGKEFNKVSIGRGAGDPSRMDVYVHQHDSIINVTKELKGGELGGMLAFRNSVLDPVINSMGRLSLVIASTMNEQHKLGIDYEGRMGANFFTDINSPEKTYGRVQGHANNAPPVDRLVSVHIQDASVLTDSDYQIEFIGPDDYTYRVRRVSDNKVLETNTLSGQFPDTLSIDGFEIRFEDGSFKKGDFFMVMPTRNESSNLQLNLTRAEQVAVASPIVTDSAIGNRGSGSITQGDVYDTGTSYFSEDGRLTPPIIVRFTSPTSYDVLDNTDPANPIPLNPPLMNQRFVPGVSNSIFPAESGKLAYTSYGGQLPTAITYQGPAPAALAVANNGFTASSYFVDFTHPVTGQVQSQQLDMPANSSAKAIAESLSKLKGVEASARTTVELSHFTNDADPLMPLTLSVNGIVVTDEVGSNQVKYAEGFPQEVPEPMTPDFIADRINSNFDLQRAGIIARSDGEKVTLIALNGEDINLELSGDMGDGFRLSNGEDITMRETGSVPREVLNEFDGYDFSKGGPYTYEFDIPGQGTFRIELDQNYANGQAMLADINAKIEASGLLSPGSVDARINERGNLSFQLRMPMNATGIHGSSKVSMGGQVKVVTESGYSLRTQPPGNSLFPTQPEGIPAHFGFNVAIDGAPKAGDEFTVGFNADGISDSRNGVSMAKLQSQDTVNGNTSYTEAYAKIVEEVGSRTSRAQISRDANEVLLKHSENSVQSKSGVNLDEEAAALIRYEQIYNANAQVIQIARSIFDTLIGAFR